MGAMRAGGEPGGAGEEDVVDVLRDAIVRAVHPRRVILFGSRARGDARRESDYDILIVVAAGRDVDEVRVEARRAMRDVPVAKDVLVVTEPAFEAWALRRSGVIREAMSDGRLLYEGA